MRVAAALLCVLGAGVWSRALAAEPPSPPQTAPTPSEQQNTTAPAGEHSTTPPNAENAIPPASAGAFAPVDKAGASKVEITAEEKELMSRGYKLQIRHGQRWFCRREAELGSHFEQLDCNTAESIISKRAASVETVREMQANKPEINK